MFTFLIIVGLSHRVSAQPAAPDLVISPHGISVAVGSAFTIDIWIKNIPSGYVMSAFEFMVFFDGAMTELVDHDNLADTPGRNWDANLDVAYGSPYHTYACSADAGGAAYNWGTDAKWATLTFQCQAEGSSIITALDEETVYLVNVQTGQASSMNFDNDQITVNQHPPAPPVPTHVGGEVFSANKLAVLSPYLALISVVAVAAVVVKRRRV